MLRLLIFFGPAAAIVSACTSQQAATVAGAPPGAFEVSFAPGSRDDAGRFMGGTEMRVLAAHAGKLYAGNGYWEDRPGPEGLQGSEILVLDGRDAAGGSIMSSTSGCRMGGAAIWPSRPSKKSPSRPTATVRGCPRRCRC